MMVCAFSRPLWLPFEKATEWNTCVRRPIHISCQGLVVCEMLMHLQFGAHNLHSCQLYAFLLSKFSIWNPLSRPPSPFCFVLKVNCLELCLLPCLKSLFLSPQHLCLKPTRSKPGHLSIQPYIALQAGWSLVPCFTTSRQQEQCIAQPVLSLIKEKQKNYIIGLQLINMCFKSILGPANHFKKGIKRASFWHTGSCCGYEDKQQSIRAASTRVFTPINGEMVFHSLQDLAEMLKMMWVQSGKRRIKFDSVVTLGELPVICLKFTVSGERMAVSKLKSNIII